MGGAGGGGGGGTIPTTSPSSWSKGTDPRRTPQPRWRSTGTPPPPPTHPSHDMSMMAVDRWTHWWHPGPPQGPHPHRPLVKLGPQLLLEDDGQQREDGEEGHPGDVAIRHHGVLVGRECVYRLTRLDHDGRRRCDAWRQKKGGRMWGDKAKRTTTPPNDTNQHNR